MMYANHSLLTGTKATLPNAWLFYTALVTSDLNSSAIEP
jgi:hypothetical protein